MQTSEAKLIASISRQSYAHFVREMWETVVHDPMHWNWHLQYQCDQLQDCWERIFRGQPKKHDLITNVSTGTGKSLIHSVFLTPWAWTRMPHACVLGASYADQLALDLGTKCRDVIRSEKYQACFPEIQIREDRDAKSLFANSKGGIRYSCGALAAVHGFHFHWLGIDDPIDPLSVLSEVITARVNYWITNTLSGRKKDKSATVLDLVMQRLHQDDPTGEMLKRGGVFHIRIPADTDYIVNPPHLLSNYVNGLMDPVRLPQSVLDSEKRTLGPQGYAAQYGQSPVPAGGGMFKVAHLRWGPVPKEFKRLGRGWDKAVTPERGSSLLKGAAFSAGVKGGLDLSGNKWILDVQRARLDTFAREDLMKRTAIQDGRGVVIGIEQEGGSGGKDSFEMSLRNLKGFRVIPFPASGSKEARADGFSVSVNGHEYWLPDYMRDPSGGWISWAKPLVEEMEYFPHSTYKDQIDAGAIMHNLISKGRLRVGVIKDDLSVVLA